MKRAAHWRETIRTLRSVEARAALDAMLPDLIDAIGQSSDPGRALARWETLLSRLPSAVNLFRLFEQRPGLLEVVWSFTMKLSDYAALGGHMDYVRPLTSLNDGTEMRQAAPPSKSGTHP